MRRNARRFFHLIFILWLVACAKQAPPSGGPADETPPKIAQVEPATGAVRVPRDTRLRFRFSEKIDHRSLKEAIFVTPNPGGELRLDWHGAELEIIFPDSLRMNTTYVVTLGTGVRDLRNNRMETSFNLAFSTGDSIAGGEIQGRVFGDKIQGLLAGAYRLKENQSLEPSRTEADYTTQTGKNGDFEFRYLAEGSYRLFAMEDKYGNRLYDRGEDMIAVASRDVNLSVAGTMRAENLNLRLAMEDTLRPTLTAVIATDSRHLQWRFDEPVAPFEGDWFAHLQIFDSQQGAPPFTLLASAPDPLNPQHVHSFTLPQALGDFRARASNLFDPSGLPLDTLFREVEFTSSQQPDTVRPRLLRVTPADSSRGVALNTPVELTFSELMRMDSTMAALVVRDSAGVSVEGVGAWKNYFQYSFLPLVGWQSRMKYTIEMLRDSLRPAAVDLSGLALLDTVRQRVFWTLNADTLGSIRGEVADAVAGASGVLRIAAKQIVGGKAQYETTVESPRPYAFDAVLPGVYQLSVYRDENKNGRYDFGRPFPFAPSERFMAATDSVKVRSRWPNEGNDLRLP